MPYIKESVQRALRHGTRPTTPGDLNFVITTIVDDWLVRNGISYTTLNAAMGVLECAKQELYRRVAAPYEDQKRSTNGEVYHCLPRADHG